MVGEGEPGFTKLADDLWMLQQMLEAHLISTNGYTVERVIEHACPRLVFEQHLARYRLALPHVAGKSVLDMACGTGYGSSYLFTQGSPSQVTGVDIDPDAVRYARLRYDKPGLEYRVADACEVWTDEKFGAITSFETIEHVPAPHKLLSAVVGMLDEEGVFFVSSPVRQGGSLRDRPGHNRFHIREWSLEDFPAMLGLFFRKVTIWGQAWPIKAGFGVRARLPGKVSRPLGMAIRTLRFSSSIMSSVMRVMRPLLSR